MSSKTLMVKFDSEGNLIYNSNFISIDECKKINWTKRFGILFNKRNEKKTPGFAYYEIFFRNRKIIDGDEYYCIYLVDAYTEDASDLISIFWNSFNMFR